MPRSKENNKKWNAFNRKLLNAIKKNDLHKMHTVYFEQAMMLKDEGCDSFPALEQSIKSGLYKEQNFEQLEILIAVDSCDTCKSLGGKLFTIEEAVQQKLLPVAGCGHEACRCTYLPVWSEPPPSELE
jgi:hypothetical protein